MNIEDFKTPLNGGNSSKGEKHLENILQQVGQELNFFYVREVKLGQYRDKRRRADFCFNYNNRTFLIEFDGIQHSQILDHFGGYETYEDIRLRDHWENTKFCPQNNICLIRYKVFAKGTSIQEHIEAQEKLIASITPERVKQDIYKAMQCKYVQNGVSYGRPKLKIALDLDDCCFNFIDAFNDKYNCNLMEMEDEKITEMVWELRTDKDFWSNLEVVERPNFTPECYCTKRVNSKSYTNKCLKKHNFPERPICQIKSQKANKATYIRKKCDILIDDSWYNVKKAIDSGFPALLITRDHNKHIDTPYRINHLRYAEIADKYYQFQRDNKWISISVK